MQIADTASPVGSSPRPRPPLPKGCTGVTMCIYGAASCRRGVNCSFAHSAAEQRAWQQSKPREKQTRKPRQVVQSVWVPADRVGVVVGTRGTRLSDLQRTANVYIQTPRTGNNTRGRKDQKVQFMVRGASEASVASACARITQLSQRSSAARCSFCSSRRVVGGSGAQSAGHNIMEGLRVTCSALRLHACGRCGVLGHSQAWCPLVSLCGEQPGEATKKTATQDMVNQWLSSTAAAFSTDSRPLRQWCSTLAATTAQLSEEGALQLLPDAVGYFWALTGNCDVLQLCEAEGTQHSAELCNMKPAQTAVLRSSSLRPDSGSLDVWVPCPPRTCNIPAEGTSARAAVVYHLTEQGGAKQCLTDEDLQLNSEAGKALVEQLDPSQRLAVIAVLSHGASAAPLLLTGARGSGVTSVLLASTAALVTKPDRSVLYVCGSESRAACAAAQLHAAGVAVVLIHLGWPTQGSAAATTVPSAVLCEDMPVDVLSAQAIVCSVKVACSLEPRPYSHLLLDDGGWSNAGSLLGLLSGVVPDGHNVVVVVGGDPQQHAWPDPLATTLLGALAGTLGGPTVAFRHNYTSRAELVRAVSGEWYGNLIASGRSRTGRDSLWGSEGVVHCVVDEGSPSWHSFVNLHEVHAVCAELGRLLDVVGSKLLNARIATSSHAQQEHLRKAVDELWPREKLAVEVMTLCEAACPAIPSTGVLIISLVGDEERLKDCPKECPAIWQAHLRAAVMATTELVVLVGSSSALQSSWVQGLKPAAGRQQAPEQPLQSATTGDALWLQLQQVVLERRLRAVAKLTSRVRSGKAVTAAQQVALDTSRGVTQQLAAIQHAEASHCNAGCAPESTQSWDVDTDDQCEGRILDEDNYNRAIDQLLVEGYKSMNERSTSMHWRSTQQLPYPAHRAADVLEDQIALGIIKPGRVLWALPGEAQTCWCSGVDGAVVLQCSNRAFPGDCVAVELEPGTALVGHVVGILERSMEQAVVKCCLHPACSSIAFPVDTTLPPIALVSPHQVSTTEQADGGLLIGMVEITEWSFSRMLPMGKLLGQPVQTGEEVSAAELALAALLPSASGGSFQDPEPPDADVEDCVFVLGTRGAVGFSVRQNSVDDNWHVSVHIAHESGGLASHSPLDALSLGKVQTTAGERWAVSLTGLVSATGQLSGSVQLAEARVHQRCFVIPELDAAKLLLGEMESTSMYAAAMEAGGYKDAAALAAAVQQLLQLWQMLQCWSACATGAAAQAPELAEQLDFSAGLHMHGPQVTLKDSTSTKCSLCCRLLHTFAHTLAARVLATNAVPVLVRPKLSEAQLQEWCSMSQALRSVWTADEQLLSSFSFELVQHAMPLPRYVTAKSASAMQLSSGPSAPCTAAADSHRHALTLRQLVEQSRRDTKVQDGPHTRQKLLQLCDRSTLMFHNEIARASQVQRALAAVAFHDAPSHVFDAIITSMNDKTIRVALIAPILPVSCCKYECNFSGLLSVVSAAPVYTLRCACHIVQLDAACALRHTAGNNKTSAAAGWSFEAFQKVQVTMTATKQRGLLHGSVALLQPLPTAGGCLCLQHMNDPQLLVRPERLPAATQPQLTTYALQQHADVCAKAAAACVACGSSFILAGVRCEALDLTRVKIHLHMSARKSAELGIQCEVGDWVCLRPHTLTAGCVSAVHGEVVSLDIEEGDDCCNECGVVVCDAQGVVSSLQLELNQPLSELFAFAHLDLEVFPIAPSHRAMRRALRMLATGSSPSVLMQALCTAEVPPPTVHAPDQKYIPLEVATRWHESLRNAFCHCVEHQLAFVKDASGDCQTAELAAALAVYFANQPPPFADASLQRVVLCCADTPEGADDLANRLAKVAGVRTVRTSARIAAEVCNPRQWLRQNASQSDTATNRCSVSMHALVRSSTTLAQQILDIEAFVGAAAVEQLPDVDVAMYYQQIVAEAEGQILQAADVVCCTVEEARWTQLATHTVVTHCIFDQVADQLPESAYLVPLCNAQHVVMLGQGSQTNSFFDRHKRSVVQIEHLDRV